MSEKMSKHVLGKSDLTVTPLGLGLAALGRPGYINLGHASDLEKNYDVSSMEAHAHTVLDAAWDAGIRYFDAARSYGRAEAFLGSWLKKREIDPKAVVVGSKWGYEYTANWQVNVANGQQHEVKEHSLAMLQKQLKESRALLGEHLDLYQIHSATLKSAVLSNKAVLDELARLRDAGLTIGLTVSGENQADVIRKALEITYSGELLFSSVQATWNLLEQSTTSALQAAHDAGLGVIIKEALANGRLTSRNAQPDFKEKLTLLKTHAEAYQTSIDALALAAVLHQPFVDIALSGAARIEHLRSNLQALNLSADESIKALQESMKEDAPTYWQKRSQLDWN